MLFCMSFSLSAETASGQHQPTAVIESVTPNPAIWSDINLLNESTVAYWSFDEGTGNMVYDSTYNGNDGNIMGNPEWVDGKFGKALQYNGSDDYIDLIKSMPDMTHLTFAVWVNFMGETSLGTIFMDATSPSQNDLVFTMNSTEIGIRADKSGADLEYENQRAVVGQDLADAWHHIAWTMAHNESKVYLDGVLMETINENGSNVGYHAAMPSIGRWWDENGNREYFPGIIDELGIWSRVLSSEEVTAHYQGNLGNLITFSGNGTDEGSIQRYAWRSSINGEFYNGSQMEIRYSALSLGVHGINLKVQDNDGNWSEKVSVILIIHHLPVASIKSITPDSAEEGEAVTFTGKGTDADGIEQYQWSSSRDGVLYQGTASAFTTDNLSVGTHTITLRVQDNNDAWSIDVQKELKVEKEEGGGNELLIVLVIVIIIIVVIGILHFMKDNTRKGMADTVGTEDYEGIGNNEGTENNTSYVIQNEEPDEATDYTSVNEGIPDESSEVKAEMKDEEPSTTPPVEKMSEGSSEKKPEVRKEDTEIIDPVGEENNAEKVEEE